MHDRGDLATVTGASTAPLWKRQLAEAIRDTDQLLSLLSLADGLRPAARRAARAFPLVVTRSYLGRMRIGDPQDPLLLQVLPFAAEEDPMPGFVEDPVDDAQAERAPGLLHKYRGRALLIASSACAIHCRYCFRRHYPYAESPKGISAWEPALRIIEEDQSIREVILSGGDPLVLTDNVLEQLSQRLEAVPHVQRLRIHSRLPIVLPERVDNRLLSWLEASRLTPWMVVHANHPQEIDEHCAAAISRLVDAGVPVLNQAVLLRGINDDTAVLAELFEKLIDLRVVPYYLHQLDPVAGAAHFLVDEARGVAIVEELRRRLPGYAVPRYVREVPGEAAKIEIG